MGSIMFTGVGGSGKDNTDVSVLLAQIGNIADLTTDDKSSLVAAINELNLDIGAMANGLKYQGTIGVDGTVSALPSTHQTGWMYKVVTADTYAGQTCEVGDMIICVQDGTVANDTDWSVVQGNTDRVVSNAGTATADHVAVFADSSGLEVKDGGYTIAANVPSDAKFTDTTYEFKIEDNTITVTPNVGEAVKLDLPDGVQISVVNSLPSQPTNNALYIVKDDSEAIQGITYVDDVGASHATIISVDGEQVSIGDGTLSDKIEEIDNNIAQNASAIGTLSDLDTAEKTSLVGAINEITVPITNNLSLTGTQSVTLTNGSENRIGEMSSLTLTLPSPIPDDYISILSFTSGATATALDYGENIKWVNGSTDVIDGIFVPIPNTRYTIVIRYDGQYVCGEVGGVAIEQTTD